MPVVTQHTGDGKANQYFLRGFNLDHGTDFATWVAGMPVNMPTHGHGQGYTDLNFLIPELVSRIDYQKGRTTPRWRLRSAGGAACITTTLRTASPARAATTAIAARYWPARRRGSERCPTASTTAQRRPVGIPDDFRKSNAPSAIRSRRRRQVRYRDGVRRQVELDRPDPAARRRLGLIGRYRLARRYRWRRRRATACSVDWQRRCRRAVPTTPTGSSTSLTLLELHLLPGRPGQRRPVRAGRRSQGPGLDRELGESGRALRHVDRNTLGFELRQDRHPAGRAVFDVRTRAPVDHPRGQREQGSAGVYGRTIRSGTTGSARSSASATTGTASTSTAIVPENSGNVTSAMCVAQGFR